jgi:hypothetical protein
MPTETFSDEGMKRFIFILMAAVFLTACEGQIKPQEDGSTPFGKDQPDATDVTDRSSCVGTPHPVKLYQKSWHVRYLFGNGVVLDRETRFTPHQVQLGMTGKYRSVEKNIYVVSRVILSTHQFEILDRDHAETTLAVGAEDFKMDLAIEPMTITYSFKGPCLSLKSGDTTLVLVPQDL